MASLEFAAEFDGRKGRDSGRYQLLRGPSTAFVAKKRDKLRSGWRLVGDV